jgi:hypothetical protein
MAEQKTPQSDRATELDERQLDQVAGGRGVITQDDPNQKPTQPADPNLRVGGTGGGTSGATYQWDQQGNAQ